MWSTYKLWNFLETATRCSLYPSDIIIMIKSYGQLVAIPVALGLQSVHALNYNKSLNSQVRSAFHGSTGITISWNTYGQLLGPSVHYGLIPSRLDQIAIGNVSVTYDTSLTYNNHVAISDLLPNMQYYYLPDHLLANTDQEPFTFTTSRPIGDMSPLHVAVVIDMGAMGDEGLTTHGGKGVDSRELLLPGEHNTIQSLASQVSTYDFVAHRKCKTVDARTNSTNSCQLVTSHTLIPG